MNSKTIDLSAERWLRVEELFERAGNLPPEERDAFLESACANDQGLRDYVASLLQEDSLGDDLIDATIVDAMSQAFGDDELRSDEMRGQKIGAYRVDRLLGAGGMGMVYLAERADEHFDQQVAIKLGRHRLVDPQTVLRLRHERQILADLDHPNIARLFDGGTMPDGVPYLVMEYIDGVRIDSYCDIHRLDTSARLRLFQTICTAVHYAHQNLIIHRDIKASNILVSQDGVPKLLDFGIAKLIDAAGEATDGLTREGAVIMTPANATPEQVQGKSVTTATDVYALGLLLYRMLSGCLPYSVDELSPSAFARVVCEHVPAKPSVRLAHAGDDASGYAANRSTTPSRLQRVLKGDLDTIILNALRKEPERRYRSAAALADDIGLHLRSMPIVARSDSWRYRTQKFVRRHVAAVSAAVLAVMVLAGFTVLLSVQNRTIVKERDTAREVSAFLEDIFRSPDPENARGASITAEEILESGAIRIREGLSKRPEIQSELMGTIGRVYYSLGEYAPSRQMLEEALRLSEAVYGPSDIHTGNAKTDLGAVLRRQAQYEESHELLQSALAIHRREDGAKSASVAKDLFNLAEVFLGSGDLDAAETAIRESAEIYASIGDSVGLELAEAKSTHARILQNRGDFAGTETLLREAISLITRTQGDDHPFMAYFLQNLAVLQRTTGDLEAAEVTLQQAAIATRRILNDEHDLLAAILVDQGVLLHARGEMVGARRVLLEALDLYAKKQTPDHPRAGYTKTILGMVLHDSAELAAAETELRDAMRIFDASLEADHQYLASAMTELGAVLNSSARSEGAMALLLEALRIRQLDYAVDHALTVATQVEYADALSRLGRFGEAETILLDSVDRLSNSPGRRYQRATAALARLYELSGKSPDTTEE